MDVDTQNHLKTLRDLLDYRLRDLRAQVQTARASQEARAEELAHEVLDRKDEALQRQSDELQQAEETRDLDELGQVEAALRRLDRGEYGDCADCGEPIGMQRLMVQPAAKRCAPCQVAFEHRHA
jgi:RNA polymerase-binding protein DksA